MKQWHKGVRAGQAASQSMDKRTTILVEKEHFLNFALGLGQVMIDKINKITRYFQEFVRHVLNLSFQGSSGCYGYSTHCGQWLQDSLLHYPVLHQVSLSSGFDVCVILSEAI